MRILGTTLLVVVGWALLLQTAPASADEAEKAVVLSATTEPAEIKPGQSGTLVVTAKLGKHWHVYATDRGSVIPLEWKPVDGAGVTYAVKSAKTTKSHELKDDTFGDIWDVWDGSFEVRVPITVAKDAAPGTKIGLLLSYSACTDEICAARVLDAEASTPLGGKAGAAAAASAKGPHGVAKPPAPVKARFKDFTTAKGARAEVTLSKDGKTVFVVVTPEPGNHVYVPPTDEGVEITVNPVAAEGVTWGAVEFPDGAGESSFPVEITIPVKNEGSTRELEIVVEFAACTEDGRCWSPGGGSVGVVVRGTGKVKVKPVDVPTKPVAGPAEPEAPKGNVIFPVKENDDLKVKQGNAIGTFYAEHGILVLGLIFLLGIGLAFTPCVLPIIPITIAVVTGGRTDLPRKRLLALLTTYVLSMALTFGAFGVIAGLAGASMSAAFQIPAVIWGIAGLFFVLAFGMLGVIEMQPPQWMAKLQGGAQQQGGSLVGAAILGCVMAFVASPCTGPAIVAMTVVLAATQSVALGFSMFFSMGLGMGAVLFAFGALNFALRPGPWMIWVRYGFGMLLFGGALYYVADPGMLKPPALWFVAAATSGLVCWLVSRHLVHKEGEQPRVAWVQGGKVGGMFVFAALLVGWLTYVPPLPEGVDPTLVEWHKLKDVDELKEMVAKNVSEGRPTVIDVWANTCHNCKLYERTIVQDDGLRFEFGKVGRLKIDTSTGLRIPLKDALGIPHDSQPYFVFIDAKGVIRRAADIDRWHKGASKAALVERLELVLGDDYGAANPGKPFKVSPSPH